MNPLVCAGAVLTDHQRPRRPLAVHTIEELSEVRELSVIPPEVEIHAEDVGNVADALVVGELTLRKCHHRPTRGIFGVRAFVEPSRQVGQDFVVTIRKRIRFAEHHFVHVSPE